MSDELRRILKMVEDKKISAEDAEKLIDALHSGRKKHEGVFEIIEDVGIRLKGIKDFAGKRELHFKGKNKLDLKGVSGDISIVGGDRDEISICCDGLVKCDEDNKTVKIKAMSGDIKADVPKKIGISLASASGDVLIDGIEGKLLLKAAVGDIQIKDFTGSFDIAGAFSTLDLDCAHLEEGKLKGGFGEVSIALNSNDNLDIEVDLKRGEIKSEIELNVDEEKQNYLKARLNKGGKKLLIKGAGGKVLFKRR